MIELFINNSPVVLPEDFQPEIVFENPFFTKSSTYSLDIELPVRDVPENIAVFGHCYRIEFDRLPESYTALMRVNGIMCFYGSAIPQGSTDVGVKLQLLSGNSEMNWSSEEVYIDELNFGSYSIPGFVIGQVRHSILVENRTTDNAKYPLLADVYNSVDKVDNLYMPIFIKEKKKKDDGGDNLVPDYVGNFLEASRSDKGERYFMNENLLYGNETPRCVQPYLMPIIRKIIESQGYSLRRNDLDATFLRNLYICNSKKTIYIARALPHWTINEFFSELEKFCSVVLVADSKEKVIDILSIPSYYENDNKAEFIEDEQILNEFETAYTEIKTNANTVTYGNVGFELDYNDGYMHLDSKIRKAAMVVEFDTFQDLWNSVSKNHSRQVYNQIFYDKATERSYIIFARNTSEEQDADFGILISSTDSTTTYLREVDLYADLIRNDMSENITKLKIVPAAMKSVNIGFWDRPGLSEKAGGHTAFEVYMPATESIETDKRSFLSIQAVIDGKEKLSESNSSDSMKVALYDGRLYNCVMDDGTHYVYPLSFTDSKQVTRFCKTELPRMSLSLKDVCQDSLGHLYRTGVHIDTSHPYTIYFIARKVYDPKQVFMIRNQKYACESIKITYNNVSEVFVAEGRFYRMKNS